MTQGRLFHSVAALVTIVFLFSSRAHTQSHRSRQVVTTVASGKKEKKKKKKKCISLTPSSPDNKWTSGTGHIGSWDQETERREIFQVCHSKVHVSMYIYSVCMCMCECK